MGDEKQYLICQDRGHQKSRLRQMTNPPREICLFCGMAFRYEEFSFSGNTQAERTMGPATESTWVARDETPMFELGRGESIRPPENEIVSVDLILTDYEVDKSRPPAQRIIWEEFDLALSMPHQCDDWVIGDVKDAKALMEEIQRAIDFIESGKVTIKPKFRGRVEGLRG